MVVSIVIAICLLIVFYLFYVSILGTPSEDALWSVIYLFIVYKVLSYLPIEWPFSEMMIIWSKPAVFVVLVVIFAADIKKLCSKIGRKFKIRHFLHPRQLSQESLDEIMSAIHLLSKTPTGALIVIQQRADLSSIMRGGIMLDARVESGLLYSIFISHRYNHLHDGAVLIHEDRITHAAVYLPMTRSMKLENPL